MQVKDGLGSCRCSIHTLFSAHCCSGRIWERTQPQGAGAGIRLHFQPILAAEGFWKPVQVEPQNGSVLPFFQLTITTLHSIVYLSWEARIAHNGGPQSKGRVRTVVPRFRLERNHNTSVFPDQSTASY